MTLRLWNLAQQNWDRFDGEMASRNVDPYSLPMDRLLNLIYWWATHGPFVEQDDIDKFDRQLWRPPKGKVAAEGSPWSADAETAAFRAFASQVGQKI